MSATVDTVIVARTPTREPRRTATRDTSRARRQVRRPAASAPAPQPSRPKRARTGVFAAFVLMILTVGLLAMLWINTTLAQGAFTLTDLQQQRTQLLETEQRLAEQLARAESPAEVEAAARSLGMVPQEVPVFVRLEDGRIIGDPIPQPEPVPVEALDETPVEALVETPVETPVEAEAEAAVDAEEAVTDAPAEVIP